MIDVTSARWQEPIAATARHLREAMQPKVTAPEVLEMLRQERDERLKAAPTIVGEASEEEAATQ